MFSRICPGILGFVAIGAISAVGPAQAQRMNIEAFIQQWDTDHSGTLSLDKIKKAATARFEALDRKHTGGLTRTQLAGILTFQQFEQANTDKRRTIDLNEFLSVVEKLFRAADKDSDGTLDKKELESSAGKTLLRLFAARQGPLI